MARGARVLTGMQSCAAEGLCMRLYPWAKQVACSAKGTPANRISSHAGLYLVLRVLSLPASLF